MKLVFLADHQQAIPTIANWYYTEWGYLSKDSSIATVTEKLQTYLNSDKIPLIILAIDNNEIIATSQLKYHEMDIYPDMEHWLGGVYVAEKHRKKGIAKIVIDKILSISSQLGVRTLYLQTERLDGGLYSKLGWQPIEQVNYCGIDVLVMEKEVR